MDETEIRTGMPKFIHDHIQLDIIEYIATDNIRMSPDGAEAENENVIIIRTEIEILTEIDQMITEMVQQGTAVMAIETESNGSCLAVIIIAMAVIK